MDDQRPTAPRTPPDGDEHTRPDPRGRCLPVLKLWLDGRLTPAPGALLTVDPDGRRWRVQAALPEHDPWAHRFGVSLQLDDGRVLHGRAGLVAAGGGTVVLEGDEAPEGGWL